MQIPVKQIVRLMQTDQPADLRRAAVVVLAEVGEKDGEIAAGLCERLDDADATVRLAALRAIGKLKIDTALPRLLERIKDGGEEADLAAQAAARLGAKGTRSLQDLMPKVAPGLRRYIASALAVGGTSSAGTAAIDMLLDTDPGVVEATARSFLSQIQTLSNAHKKSLADQLFALLKGKITPVSETATVRLLVALEDARAASVLWERIQPAHAPETRATALQALGKWTTSPNKEQLRRLFSCAADRDFRVAAPALMMLQALPADSKSRDGWLELLRAPDKMVRLVAVEKLGDQDTAEVAEALLEQLSHPDRGLREAALKALAPLKTGRQALTDALLAAETPDRAWSLAKSIVPFAGGYPESWRKTILDSACKYLEADDRRSDPLFFLVRELDPIGLRDRLEAAAVAHRKKKAYERALPYLRLLARDPACAFSIRLELAACALKVSDHDLTTQAREDDSALHQFAGLVQHHADELYPALEKIKWLEADDFYFLGFHFVEQEGASRKFGAQVLHLLLERSPKTKLAQSAKSKLKSSAL
jgi:HEAT repeat protein